MALKICLTKLCLCHFTVKTMPEDEIIDNLIEFLVNNSFKDAEDISIFNYWTKKNRIRIDNDDTVIRCLRLINDRNNIVKTMLS